MIILTLKKRAGRTERALSAAHADVLGSHTKILFWLTCIPNLPMTNFQNLPYTTCCLIFVSKVSAIVKTQWSANVEESLDVFCSEFFYLMSFPPF